MAKEKEVNTPPASSVVPRNISVEMRESYLDYAMSVITSRALPDVRDGLKPVHRRILYTMGEMGLSSSARFRKSAAIVGEVLGKYHPHGDTAVYDALAKLAQTFTTRYPLIIGQGNFGCFTSDTKIRLADGRRLAFKELVHEYEQGKRNFTYTIDQSGRTAIAEIQYPRRTRKDAELAEVVLDNGERLRCTPDHRFMLRDGTYRAAQALVAGDSLMPLYTRLHEGPDKNLKGYEEVYQPAAEQWTFAHHLADAYNLANGVYPKARGRIRHHLDFDKYNNNPTNIQRLHWREHWKLHYNLTATRHATDAGYRAKLAAGRKTFWDDPENRNRYAERISERNRRQWKNPTYRERMRAFLSAVNKQYIHDHPEKRQELSARATRTMKRLWRDPEHEARMRVNIVKGNQNHTTNRTGLKKFLAVCGKLVERGMLLSEENYEKVRPELYPYGRATKWQTAIQKYFQNRPEAVMEEIHKNHKVRTVRSLTEREDVYDLTIDGSHNFALAAGVFVHNSIDGDSPAAMRYTEAKMSSVAGELMHDLQKETVAWRPNYDGTKKEPIVLPASVPNILLNGTLGIAVGMATNVPPHNLKEVCEATVHLIDNKDAANEDLVEFVKGPDFPTGGIAFNQKDILHAYANGKGPVVTRGEAEIVEDKKGEAQIVITSIPYRVNKSDLLIRIADLVRDKKLEGVKGLRDESTKDIRVVIELKGGAHPQKVLNYLYAHTQLEETFHYNWVLLVDGVPQTLSLKGILEEFIEHRKTVVRRRSEFDLARAKEREHILLGLSKALDHIDAVIKLIKAAKDVPAAHAELKKNFKFSDAQATAILEMKLSRLAGLERKKIEDELKAVQALIKDLEDLLAHPKKILAVIKKELQDIAAKYGDERRTKIMKGGVKMLSVEDLIPDEESMLVLSAGGYIKRTNPAEYRKQKRGGVGVIDLDTKEEDFVTTFLTASTHSDLLFFTDKGKAYQIKMYDIPEGRRSTKGKSVMNFLSLSQDEKITSILPLSKEAKGKTQSLFMITKNGIGKKVNGVSFHDVRRSGLIAIKLKGSDELVSALLVEKGDQVVVATGRGQSIRFKESDIREMGRGAGGVRAMKLQKGDSVVAASVIGRGDNKQELLVLSKKGYGKKTSVEEYKVQKRGGSGIKTSKVTDKTGPVIASRIVTPEDIAEGEVVVISKKGQVIRTDLKGIPSLSRATQGVRVMKLREGDSIASFVCL